MEDKDLISLKEAAKISGYSPDYVGQLIRSGKIPGKQVYYNVAWMTTADAVLNYKNKGKNGSNNKIQSNFRKLQLELNIIKLFFSTFKSAFPILITLIISFILLSVFFVYSIYSTVNKSTPVNQTPPEKTITF